MIEIATCSNIFSVLYGTDNFKVGDDICLLLRFSEMFNVGRNPVRTKYIAYLIIIIRFRLQDYRENSYYTIYIPIVNLCYFIFQILIDNLIFHCYTYFSSAVNLSGPYVSYTRSMCL